jgi:non-ribosomal peptide synthetase component E (peptide arylation enzyme)
MLSPWEGIVIETRGGVPLKMYKDRPRSLGQVLEETVRRVPHQDAIVCESTRWNYQELRLNGPETWNSKGRSGFHTSGK